MGYGHIFTPIPCIHLNSFLAFAHVPLMITIGTESKKPLVIDEEIKLREVVNVTMTVDYRFVNEVKAARVYKKFTSYLEDPTRCEEVK